jgi:hypothetical protein
LSISISLFLAVAIILTIIFATPWVFGVTVTFETNHGTQIDDIEIRKGRALPRISQPERQYNDFGGWYIDSDLTIPYDNQPINKDTTLYAKWLTHFDEQFFYDKIDLLNEIYDFEINLDDFLIKDKELILQAIMEDEEAPFSEIENFHEFLDMFIFFDNNFIMGIFLSLNDLDMANYSFDFLLDSVKSDEYLSDGFSFGQRDTLLYLLPKGMEDLVFGEIFSDDNFYYGDIRYKK